MKNLRTQVIEAFLARKTFVGNRIAVTSVSNAVPTMRIKITLLAYQNSVIAIIDKDNQLWVDLAGYNTISTKSLLNLIPGVKIRTINKQLMINDIPWNGKVIFIKNMNDDT